MLDDGNTSNNKKLENDSKNEKIEKIKINKTEESLCDKWDYIKRTIPVLPLNLAIMIFISNLFFPSSGTFYLSFIGNEFKKSQLIVALIQLLCVFIFIGWPWSIYWGYLTIKKSL